MAIQGQDWPTYLVSQNKRIDLWHRQLAHISNSLAIWASKFIDGIQQGYNDDKKYDHTKVFIDSNSLDISDASDSKKPLTMPSGIEITCRTIVC